MQKIFLLVIISISACSTRDFSFFSGGANSSQPVVSEIQLLNPTASASVQIEDVINFRANIASVENIQEVLLNTPQQVFTLPVAKDQKTYILSQKLFFSNTSSQPAPDGTYEFSIIVTDANNQTIRSNFSTKLAVASTHFNVNIPSKPTTAIVWAGNIVLTITATGADPKQIDISVLGTTGFVSVPVVGGQTLYNIPINTLLPTAIDPTQIYIFRIEITSIHDRRDFTDIAR